MIMAMTIGYSCKSTVLFKVFSSEDCIDLFAFLVVSFILGLAFEFILGLRQKLLSIYREQSVEKTLYLKEKLLLTSLYTIAIILSVIHMFILMSYNLWIILSLVFGNIVGYFLFGLNASKKRGNSILQESL